MNRLEEQGALAGMVVEEAVNNAREGRVVWVFSPKAERVVGHPVSQPREAFTSFVLW